MRMEMNDLDKQIAKKDLKINQAEVAFQASKTKVEEVWKRMEMFDELNQTQLTLDTFSIDCNSDYDQINELEKKLSN